MTPTKATPFDGEPPLTAAQRSAIISDSHTLIAAGAGSGKTTTLVDKILYALGADRVPGRAPARLRELHQVAAITFTNAAAADLKRKLRERLRKVADWYSATGDLAQSAIWRARVYDVDRVRIGTIHSFCGAILRDFALRLGMDPGFTVLEQSDSSQLRVESVTEILDGALVSRPSTMTLIETIGLAKTERALEHLVQRADILTEVRDSWADDNGPLVAQLRALVGAQRVAWGCGDDEGHWHDELDPLSARLSAELVHLAIAVRRRIAERLDELSAVDFDEMILRTRTALRDDASVLQAVRDKLTWVFVDEFQDTDLAQLEIAKLITNFDNTDDSTDGASAPSLCIVGDPKQSIYRFRRADVSLWGQLEQSFRSKGIAPIVLDANFRSTAPIVAYVNATFGGLIGHSPEAVIEIGHDVSYIPLVEHRRPPADSRAVELLDTAGEDTGKAPSAEQRRADEAERVAARIVELVDGYAAIWDDRAGAFRAATWRDVAILVRTRTPVPAFEAAFRRHRIPSYIRSLTGFFARREVMDVRLLLQALADRHDDMAWLGLLRSPFVGLTDEAILRARLAHPDAPLSATIRDSGAEEGTEKDAAIFTRARTLIQQLTQLRDRVTVAELIQYAADEAGYSAYLLTQSGGELAAMNLRKLIQIADGRSADTVAEFIDFIDDSVDADANEGDAALFTAGEDVVTITTIHSAKGLEWPIVFLVDLDSNLARVDKSPILVDPDAGMALPLEADKTKPGAWGYLKKRNHELSLAEEKRVWYVGATRARDRLVLCANRGDVTEALSIKNSTTDGDAKTIKHWLLQALTQTEEAHSYADGETHMVDDHTSSPRTAPAALMANLPTLSDLVTSRDGVDVAVSQRLATVPSVRSLPRYSATQLMTVAKDPNEYERRYVQGVFDRRVFSRTGTGHGDQAPLGVPASILGEVLHGAMEQDRSDDDLVRYIEVGLSSALGEAGTSPRVQSATMHIRQLVEQSKTHPAIARLYDSERCERELDFTWFVHGDAGSVTIGGAMDLIALIDGRPEIIDFKSHKLRSGEEQRTAAGYLVQRHVYSAACAAITGTTPSRFTFFFPETATAVDEGLDRAGIDAAEANVRELIARVPSGVV